MAEQEARITELEQRITSLSEENEQLRARVRSLVTSREQLQATTTVILLSSPKIAEFIQDGAMTIANFVSRLRRIVKADIGILLSLKIDQRILVELHLFTKAPDLPASRPLMIIPIDDLPENFWESFGLINPGNGRSFDLSRYSPMVAGFSTILTPMKIKQQPGEQERGTDRVGAVALARPFQQPFNREDGIMLCVMGHQLAAILRNLELTLQKEFTKPALAISVEDIYNHLEDLKNLLSSTVNVGERIVEEIEQEIKPKAQS